MLLYSDHLKARNECECNVKVDLREMGCVDEDVCRQICVDAVEAPGSAG
jgi:hypothetical protein